MEGTGMLIIATLLSAAIFSLLFYLLNDRICGIFKPIQRDLGKLNKGTRRILNFAGFILAILISVYLRIILDLSAFSTGLILGFLGGIIDTCFSKNIVENNMKIVKSSK